MTAKGYTAAAVAALVEAHAAERDWGGWMAAVLAQAAAQVGGSEALVSGRPGSWESAAIRGFLASIVGPDDEALPLYGAMGGGDGTT